MASVFYLENRKNEAIEPFKLTNTPIVTIRKALRMPGHNKKRTLAEASFWFFERSDSTKFGILNFRIIRIFRIIWIIEIFEPCERIRPERAHHPNVYGRTEEKEERERGEEEERERENRRKRRKEKGEKWVKKRASKKLIKRLPLLFVCAMAFDHGSGLLVDLWWALFWSSELSFGLHWLSTSSTLALLWLSAGHYDWSMNLSLLCPGDLAVWPGISSEGQKFRVNARSFEWTPVATE